MKDGADKLFDIMRTELALVMERFAHHLKLRRRYEHFY